MDQRSINTGDRCISVTNWGYAPTYKNFLEWAREDIQDYEVAIEVAQRMLEWHPNSYPYNEDQEPQVYQEFDISNMDEFTMQLHVTQKLLDEG